MDNWDDGIPSRLFSSFYPVTSRLVERRRRREKKERKKKETNDTRKLVAGIREMLAIDYWMWLLCVDKWDLEWESTTQVQLKITKRNRQTDELFSRRQNLLHRPEISHQKETTLVIEDSSIVTPQVVKKESSECLANDNRIAMIFKVERLLSVQLAQTRNREKKESRLDLTLSST